MRSGEETILLTLRGQVGESEGNRVIERGPEDRQAPPLPKLKIEGLGLCGWVWGPLELR